MVWYGMVGFGKAGVVQCGAVWCSGASRENRAQTVEKALNCVWPDTFRKMCTILSEKSETLKSVDLNRSYFLGSCKW